MKRFLGSRIGKLSWLVCLAGLLPMGLYAWQDGPSEALILQGQQAIYRLDFEGAGKTFQRLIDEYPDHPAGYGMYTNVTLNRLLFAAKNLALDDYATPTPFFKQPTYKPIGPARKRFVESVDRLIQVCDRRLERNPRDALALYFKGFAYENLASEALAVRKSTGAAQNLGKKARIFHEQALLIDPSLVDANTSIAVYEFAAATLPWNIKWLAFLLGYRGNKARALERLNMVAEKGLYRKFDAQVLLALLHAWKGEPQEAVTIFNRLRQQFPQNFLSDINLAAIYQLSLDDHRSALEVYRQLLQDIGDKAPGLQAGEVHYRIGKAHLALGQINQAFSAFEKAVQAPRAELETLPLAHFQIAQIHEQRGERAMALQHYRAVLQYPGPKRILEDELKKARRKVR